MSEESLEDRALALVKTQPNGILQSELWKDLGIDSRKCSRVIAKLEAEGKIKRTWETVKGTRTYRISYLPQKKEAPKKEVDFGLIMARDEVAPCIGCTYECEPDYCPDLGNWVELLARTSAREARREEQAAAAKAREPKVEEAEEEPVARGKKAAPKAAKEEKAAAKEAPKAAAGGKKSAKPAKKPEEKPLKAAKSTKRSK